MQNLPHSNTPKTSGLAIVSLVFGILDIIGLAICGGSFVAIICGHLALSKIKQSGGTISGRGIAIAGLVLGYVSLAITALFMLGMGGIAMIGAHFESSQKAQADKEMMQERAVAVAKGRAEAGDLAQYTGTLQCRESLLYLSVENDTLKLASTDMTDKQCDMQPVGKDYFAFQKCTKLDNARLIFSRNKSGEIDSATIRYENDNFSRCKKL